MAFDLSSISAEARLRAPRIVLLGVEKIGKSTFASQANKPIFIPIIGEEGIDAIPVPQFPTCNTFRDVQESLYSLLAEEHQYETVVIDSVSALEPLIWAETCMQHGGVDSIEKVGGGYAKGYSEALRNWRDLTSRLDALRAQKNMTNILIGHVKVKRFDDPAGPSYDQYQFDLHEKAANLLFRWADVVLFANTKVAVKTQDIGFGKEKGRGIDIAPGQRFLYTQKTPAHPGGGRGVYGQLPYELPLSWGNYQDAIAARVAQLQLVN